MLAVRVCAPRARSGSSHNAPATALAFRRSGHGRGHCTGAPRAQQPAPGRPGQAAAARRPTADYASRRGANDEENLRRAMRNRGATAEPASNGSGPARDAVPTRRVVRRRTVDMAARRSAARNASQRAHPVSDGWASMNGSQGASNGAAAVDRRAARRQSADYASRRAQGDEENVRRGLSVPTRRVRRPTRDLVRNGAAPARVEQPRRDEAADNAQADGTGGVQRRPPVLRRKAPSYASRRASKNKRRHSVDRFSLEEVKKALVAHKHQAKARAAARQTPTRQPTAAAASRSDSADKALRSVDRLMNKVCVLSNMSIAEMEAAAQENGARSSLYQGASGRDPAETALSSVSAMAGAIAQLSH